MKRYIKLNLLLLTISLLFNACAKSEKSSQNQNNKQYLNAFIETHYKGAPTNENHGFWILKDDKGSGKEYNNQKLIEVEYTIKDLDSTIQATSSKDLSIQLGNYKAENYYGPRMWYVSHNTLPAGVIKMLQGMKEGGHKTCLIPSWLNVYEEYNNYFANQSDSPNVIYDIKLNRIIGNTDKDITQWEVQNLENYVKKHMPNTDSTKYGFYFKPGTITDNSTIEENSLISINFIAKRLDGTIFDTNIENVAKDANIYNPYKSYTPMIIKWSSDANNISIINNGQASTTIEGFQMMLSKMKLKENKAIGAFISTYGYGANSLKDILPACSQLSFEISTLGTATE